MAHISPWVDWTDLETLRSVTRSFSWYIATVMLNRADTDQAFRLRRKFDALSIEQRQFLNNRRFHDGPCLDQQHKNCNKDNPQCILVKIKDIQVTRLHFERLLADITKAEHSRWLDDTVIAAYVRLIRAACLSGQRRMFCVADTYPGTKLKKGQDNREHIDSVLRACYRPTWCTRQENPHNMQDMVGFVAPLHINGNHFGCVHVSPTSDNDFLYDSLPGRLARQLPLFLHEFREQLLYSAQKQQVTLATIAERRSNYTDANRASWKRGGWTQGNESDCGVITCFTMDCITDGINISRWVKCKTVLDPAQVYTLRERIAFELVAGAMLSSGTLVHPISCSRPWADFKLSAQPNLDPTSPSASLVSVKVYSEKDRPHAAGDVTSVNKEYVCRFCGLPGKPTDGHWLSAHQIAFASDGLACSCRFSPTVLRAAREGSLDSLDGDHAPWIIQPSAKQFRTWQICILYAQGYDGEHLLRGDSEQYVRMKCRWMEDANRYRCEESFLGPRVASTLDAGLRGYATLVEKCISNRSAAGTTKLRLHDGCLDNLFLMGAVAQSAYTAGTLRLQTRDKMRELVQRFTLPTTSAETLDWAKYDQMRCWTCDFSPAVPRLDAIFEFAQQQLSLIPVESAIIGSSSAERTFHYTCTICNAGICALSLITQQDERGPELLQQTVDHAVGLLPCAIFPLDFVVSTKSQLTVKSQECIYFTTHIVLVATGWGTLPSHQRATTPSHVLEISQEWFDTLCNRKATLSNFECFVELAQVLLLEAKLTRPLPTSVTDIYWSILATPDWTSMKFGAEQRKRKSGKELHYKVAHTILCALGFATAVDVCLRKSKDGRGSSSINSVGAVARSTSTPDASAWFTRLRGHHVEPLDEASNNAIAILNECVNPRTTRRPFMLGIHTGPSTRTHASYDPDSGRLLSTKPKDAQVAYGLRKSVPQAMAAARMVQAYILQLLRRRLAPLVVDLLPSTDCPDGYLRCTTTSTKAHTDLHQIPKTDALPGLTGDICFACGAGRYDTSARLDFKRCKNQYAICASCLRGGAHSIGRTRILAVWTAVDSPSSILQFHSVRKQSMLNDLPVWHVSKGSRNQTWNPVKESHLGNGQAIVFDIATAHRVKAHPAYQRVSLDFRVVTCDPCSSAAEAINSLTNRALNSLQYRFKACRSPSTRAAFFHEAPDAPVLIQKAEHLLNCKPLHFRQDPARSRCVAHHIHVPPGAVTTADIVTPAFLKTIQLVAAEVFTTFRDKTEPWSHDQESTKEARKLALTVNLPGVLQSAPYPAMGTHASASSIRADTDQMVHSMLEGVAHAEGYPSGAALLEAHNSKMYHPSLLWMGTDSAGHADDPCTSKEPDDEIIPDGPGRHIYLIGIQGTGIVWIQNHLSPEQPPLCVALPPGRMVSLKGAARWDFIHGVLLSSREHIEVTESSLPQVRIAMVLRLGEAKPSEIARFCAIHKTSNDSQPIHQPHVYDDTPAGSCLLQDSTAVEVPRPIDDNVRASDAAPMAELDANSAARKDMAAKVDLDARSDMFSGVAHNSSIGKTRGARVAGSPGFATAIDAACAADESAGSVSDGFAAGSCANVGTSASFPGFTTVTNADTDAASGVCENFTGVSTADAAAGSDGAGISAGPPAPATTIDTGTDVTGGVSEGFAGAISSAGGSALAGTGLSAADDFAGPPGSAGTGFSAGSTGCTTAADAHATGGAPEGFAGGSTGSTTADGANATGSASEGFARGIISAEGNTPAASADSAGTRVSVAASADSAGPTCCTTAADANATGVASEGFARGITSAEGSAPAGTSVSIATSADSAGNISIIRTRSSNREGTGHRRNKSRQCATQYRLLRTEISNSGKRWAFVKSPVTVRQTHIAGDHMKNQIGVIARQASHYNLCIPILGYLRTQAELTELQMAGKYVFRFPATVAAWAFPPGYIGVEPFQGPDTDYDDARAFANAVNEINGAIEKDGTSVDQEDGPYIMIQPPFLILRDICPERVGCEIGTCYNYNKDERKQLSYDFTLQAGPESRYENMKYKIREQTKRTLVGLYRQLALLTKPLHSVPSDIIRKSHRITKNRVERNMSPSLKASLPADLDLHGLLLDLTSPSLEIDEHLENASKSALILSQAEQRLERATEDKPWLLGTLKPGTWKELLRDDATVQEMMNLWTSEYEKSSDESANSIERQWRQHACAVMAACASMQMPRPELAEVREWQTTQDGCLSRKSHHGFRMWLHGLGISDNMFPNENYQLLNCALHDLQQALQDIRESPGADWTDLEAQQLSDALDALAGALLYERAHSPEGKASWTNLTYDGGPGLRFFAQNFTIREMLHKDNANNVGQLQQIVAEATGRQVHAVTAREALAHTQSLLIHQFRRAMFEMGVVGVEYFNTQAALTEMFPHSNSESRRSMMRKYQAYLNRNNSERYLLAYSETDHGQGFRHSARKPREKSVIMENGMWDDFVRDFLTPGNKLSGSLKPATHVKAYMETYKRFSSALTAADPASTLEQLEDANGAASEHHTLESNVEQHVYELKYQQLALDRIYEGTARAKDDGTIDFDQTTITDIAANKAKGVAPSIIANLMAAGAEQLQLWDQQLNVDRDPRVQSAPIAAHLICNWTFKDGPCGNIIGPTAVWYQGNTGHVYETKIVCAKCSRKKEFKKMKDNYFTRKRKSIQYKGRRKRTKVK